MTKFKGPEFLISFVFFTIHPNSCLCGFPCSKEGTALFVVEFHTCFDTIVDTFITMPGYCQESLRTNERGTNVAYLGKV